MQVWMNTIGQHQAKLLIEGPSKAKTEYLLKASRRKMKFYTEAATAPFVQALPGSGKDSEASIMLM